MAKFHKQEYYNKTENKIKIFSYTIPVPKAIVEQANMENCEVEFKIKDGRIIIEKALDKQKF